MTGVARLGYLGLEVSRPEEWAAFATRTIGLGAAPRASDGALTLRMDDQAQRFRIHEGKADDLAYLGWEVDDRAALDAIAAKLKGAGVPVEPGSADAAAARGVAGFATTRDPSGIRLELFHGPARSTPHRSSVMPSGFVTGAEGMGHIFLFVDDAAKTESFYRDLLGLRISDYVDATLGGTEIHAVFFHANARHHSLAFSAATAPKRLHHVMLEVNSLDDVGTAFDRVRADGTPILLELGRHPNDKMISFYGVTPAGFAFEIGHGGLKVDDARWEVRTYDRISDWGHRPAAAHG